MPRRLNLSPAEHARLRKQIGDLYLRGTTQVEIAAALRVSQATVSRELEWWQKRWEKEHVADLHKARLRELAKIDRLEVAAHAAWERSQQDAETRHAETTSGRATKDGDPLPDLTKASKTFKGQCGDPRFLERVAWCIDQRCKILGLIVTRIAPTDPSGTKEYAASDTDRAAALQRLYARLGAAPGVADPGRQSESN